jgi:hypothetical protein
VPPLPVGFTLGLPTLVVGDAAGILGTLGGQWGIFDASGQPILPVDAVDSIEYARDYRASDYPQEEGAFESYNKVQLPYEAKIGFLLETTRVVFLNEIEDMLASLDLVSIVTPEVTYASANLVHYGYRRTSRRGRTMILVEVWLEEIRITATANLSNAQSINAQPTTQNGTTQPTQPANATTTQAAPAAPGSQQASSPADPLDPTFYKLSHADVAPNAWNSLTAPQQQSITSLGTQFGNQAGANAGPLVSRTTAPDSGGNSVASFLGLTDEGPF